MKTRAIIIALFSLAVSVASYGQQDPMYSQYMFNMMGINPAYAGSREVLSLTAMMRSQWTGVEGAPVSQVITGDFASKSKKVGLGFQAFSDQIGIMNTTGVNFSYAYRLQFRKGVFAMGLNGGFSQFRANYTAVQLSSGDYDPSFAQNANEFRPTVGAGVFYNTDKFYVGFSAPHLLQNTTYYSKDSGSPAQYQNDHWFLSAGYVFDLSYDVQLKASTMVRMVSGAPVSADINANFWFYNTVSIGASVRSSKMLVGMTEIQVSKQLRVGYAYDYTSNWALVSGSHEFMLRYEFGFEKKGMMSPRHF